MQPLGARSDCCATGARESGYRLQRSLECRPAVYRGPEGSYFGYSVDFYRPTPESSTLSVLVGAPKANTSQPGIIEGGAVYYCPYPPNPDPTKQPYSCTQIPFDNANNRMIKVNGTREPLEFKSHQWFGASVRTHKGKVVACAPLYHWRTVKVDGEKDPVGTCFVAVQNFSAYAEYSPCRTNDPDPEGQGFCQAGFSVDFTKKLLLPIGSGVGLSVTDHCVFLTSLSPGQVMTAGVAEILNGYSLKAVLRRVPGEKHTHAAADTHDDSYLGYSVAVGEFTGDSEQELIAGVPRGAQNFGYVAVINSTNLTFIMNFTGEQMASYFGYSVAVTDLNGDGYDDVLVGAPLYMERERESKPKEVGRVYLYLQHSPLTFSEPLLLTGTHTFGRFGTAIAPLGDLNQDGYNDVAVGCPFGGEDRSGLVLIYNGQKDLTARGLTLSQELYGAWTSSSGLSGYGFTLRGDRDLDNNHYPEYTHTHKHTSAPDGTIWNPSSLSPFIPLSPPLLPVLNAELQLDWLKGLRGGVKRVHFLDSHQPQHTEALTLGNSRPHSCLNYTVYLREEDEFRDKLTPISLALNYSLAPPSNLDLPPVLNRYSSTFLQEQAYILLDCGEDNKCIPDLQLSAKLVVGDDNLVMLTINAVNKGEGAYETELHTLLPPEADYIGVERRIEYRMVNDSRLVVCDLGNPMVAGTEVNNSKSNPVSLSLSISARAQLDLRGVCHPSQVVLPFPHWEPKENPVKEDDVGPQVTHIYELHNSGPSSIREAELQVGWPSRFRDEHLLYALEVLTDGPISCRSNTSLNPLGLQVTQPHLLLRLDMTLYSCTDNCSNIICLGVLCVVGRLDRGQSAVVKIRSRLWAHTFLQRRNDPYLLNSTVSFRVTALPYRLQPSSLPQHTTSMGTLVLWGTPDVAFAVPLWVIILAILLGLLVLAMLTLAMWKCGFFDRARPPADDVSDREQLTSDQLADA
uniref:Integrin subunit alpha 8 n=1 Tax=Salmo trutta TaxID=8032 RepID=A0A673XIR8_SALTR